MYVMLIYSPTDHTPVVRLHGGDMTASGSLNGGPLTAENNNADASAA